jgi:TPR repeat protein
MKSIVMLKPARTLLGAILAMPFVISAAFAGPLEDGAAAYDRGDYPTALKLWRSLANQGSAKAQALLGVMYDDGQGVPQDYAEAIKWYRLAADHGVAVAQVNLGLMYFKGLGVPQNYVQAHVWWNLAAANPYSDKEARDKAVLNRDLVARKMTAAQIAEAQKLASEWKAK